MTNHPNRSRAAEQNFEIDNVRVSRISYSVVEWTISADDDEAEYTYHANRYATFHGPHTGRGDARQLRGQARSPWRERDVDLLKRFHWMYPNATVTMR